MRGITRYVSWVMCAIALGVLLALLLPIYFVAGIEALIIIIMACCQGFGKK